MEDMSKRRRILATKGKDTSRRAKPLVAGAGYVFEQVFEQVS